MSTPNVAPQLAERLDTILTVLDMLAQHVRGLQAELTEPTPTKPTLRVIDGGQSA